MQIGGKQIESAQPFLNIVKHFKMISEMNVNDITTIGPTLGFSKELDSVRSMRYVSGTSATTAASGNGLTNNRPYGQGEAQSAIVESQNSTTCNPAILGKINRYIDTSANSNNITSLVSVTQLNNEFIQTLEFGLILVL